MDLTKISLAEYLKHLETLWQSFANPLYSLKGYLAMGKSVWDAENTTQDKENHHVL